MIRPKGLGRGLDALLAATDETPSNDSLQTLAIDRLRPGKYQPRTKMDAASLAEVAGTIAGDNTVFVACADGTTPMELDAELRSRL